MILNNNKMITIINKKGNGKTIFFLFFNGTRYVKQKSHILMALKRVNRAFRLKKKINNLLYIIKTKKTYQNHLVKRSF